MKTIELTYDQIVLLELISQKQGQYPTRIKDIEELLNQFDLEALKAHGINYDNSELPEAVRRIINYAPGNLSDDEMIEYARNAYIQLGREYSYDENFYILSVGLKKAQLVNKRFKDISDNKVVCRSISKLYLYTLITKGIDAKIVFEEKEEEDEEEEEDENDIYGHSYVVIRINGKKYKTDLTLDFSRIKNGLKTKYFMTKRNYDEDEYSYISEEKVRAIDDKINYTYNRNVYG